jgi:TolB protein
MESSVVLAAVRLPHPTASGTLQAGGAVVSVVFVDASTGVVRSERVVRLADHFVNQLLPYFDQYALSHRLWSPDGTSILLPLVDNAGRDRLVVVSADGSEPRPIADGVSGFWSP